MAADDRVRIRVKRGDWEFEVEGDKDFVEARVAQALEEWGQRPGSPAAPTALSAPPGGTGRLKEFVTAKAPGGHLETAAVLGVWARANEGLEDLGGSDLERLYKLAELKRPADPVNVMAQAASQKGWFQSIGNGRYRLMSAGEDFVAFDLPRKKVTR